MLRATRGCHVPRSPCGWLRGWVLTTLAPPHRQRAKALLSLGEPPGPAVLLRGLSAARGSSGPPTLSGSPRVRAKFAAAPEPPGLLEQEQPLRQEKPARRHGRCRGFCTKLSHCQACVKEKEKNHPISVSAAIKPPKDSKPLSGRPPSGESSGRAPGVAAGSSSAPGWNLGSRAEPCPRSHSFAHQPLLPPPRKSCCGGSISAGETESSVWVLTAALGSSVTSCDLPEQILQIWQKGGGSLNRLEGVKDKRFR